MMMTFISQTFDHLLRRRSIKKLPQSISPEQALFIATPVRSNRSNQFRKPDLACPLFTKWRNQARLPSTLCLRAALSITSVLTHSIFSTHQQTFFFFRTSFCCSPFRLSFSPKLGQLSLHTASPCCGAFNNQRFNSFHFLHPSANFLFLQNQFLCCSPFPLSFSSEGPDVTAINQSVLCLSRS